MALVVGRRGARARAAESNEFRVARQPGLVYIQAIIMEEKKLIEKHAAALGLKDVKVQWSIITSGGVMTEAIISNSIDMAITGVSNLLLAWGKTRQHQDRHRHRRRAVPAADAQREREVDQGFRTRTTASRCRPSAPRCRR